MVDDFITSVSNKGGAQGRIRAWSLIEERSASRAWLTFQMANYRWCERIGRAHKSNHIYIEVHVQRGQWRQRCHDPDCARSGRMPAWHDAPQTALPRGL